MAASRLSLVARVERRLDQLAQQMVQAFTERIPVYAMLPQEQLAGEIRDICRENLRIFFRCVRQDRPPTDSELAEPRASAARRAEERVPLEAVLTAYHIGGRIGWTAMVDEAREDEHEDLLRVAGLVMDYLDSVTAAVAAAYLEEQQHIYSEQHDARRAFTEALTSPARVDEQQLHHLASRAGVRLSPGYLALALAIGPSSDEQDAGVSGTVAARRKVRRLQGALQEVTGEPPLSLLSAGGGTVLLPVGAGHAEAALDGVEDLVARLAAEAAAPILCGAAWRAGADRTAEAAAEAHEVLRLARALGRPPGAYRIDDVLLEHAVTAEAGTAERLNHVLAPLQARPELLETLEAWFDGDFDRRQAAAHLHVHPNTLDYRLRRVADLTGVDPASARGLQLLGAALTARRVRTAD